METEIIEGELVRTGSTNVFADLGLPNPEGRLLKAQLMRAINAAIRRRALTQEAAAALVDLKIGLDLRGLEPQLGAFEVPEEGAFSWKRRIGLAQASLRQAGSWAGLHRELEAIGFALEKSCEGAPKKWGQTCRPEFRPARHLVECCTDGVIASVVRWGTQVRAALRPTAARPERPQITSSESRKQSCAPTRIRRRPDVMKFVGCRIGARMVCFGEDVDDSGLGANRTRSTTRSDPFAGRLRKVSTSARASKRT